LSYPPGSLKQGKEKGKQSRKEKKKGGIAFYLLQREMIGEERTRKVGKGTSKPRTTTREKCNVKKKRKKKRGCVLKSCMGPSVTSQA